MVTCRPKLLLDGACVSPTVTVLRICDEIVHGTKIVGEKRRREQRRKVSAVVRVSETISVDRSELERLRNGPGTEMDGEDRTIEIRGAIGPELIERMVGHAAQR